ncbi:FAD-binding domain-containing protein [Periconia macrospinosa]|uniref:FAD-binding domain-containing protein n=1 Tax=Periconia macrospinosa TaxID=97972 RepID=A0A2V1EDT7_9PLEO|nr:FAD-binding domain-containing protein [Periconia macrospinosa]
MFLPSLTFLVLPTFLQTITALNFAFEEIQLTEAETLSNPSIRFGDLNNPAPPSAEPCKVTPQDQDWPTDTEWADFNATLGGVLLKPRPLALPCYNETTVGGGSTYNATRCEAVKSGWGNMALHANDPISVRSQWATGDSCVPTGQPNSKCSQGGYPVYVINATTVRHVQMAVNFARNKNIRVVVKNSGHDFNGKNIGAHSLSIWVHNLKGAEYHADYTTSNYAGRALVVGAGTQASDVYSIRTTYNTTIQLPGGATVGVVGGYAQGGGHSSYSSLYGLTADNVLRIHAVTADGKFVTADPDTNQDLYWAFRGGGGGNFGIVTSMVIAAFPQTPLASSSISFSTLPRAGQPGLSVDTFWQGVETYFSYGIAICEEGGLGYDFIRHSTSGNSTGLTFTVSISLPFKTASEVREFLQPLRDQLREIGIMRSVQDESTNTTPDNDASISAIGDTVHHTLIASRLFQRSNFATPSSLSELRAAVRYFVEEGGYDFHGQTYNPSLETDAYDTDNAVHPGFRTAIMHAQGYERTHHWDGVEPVVPVAEQAQRHDRMQSYIQRWKEITPGSGSYMNEGDAQTKDWKDAFWGENYERLEGVKRKFDPWGMFWVLGGVGSDAWEVRGSSGGGREGLFTQDGTLCKVEI